MSTTLTAQDLINFSLSKVQDAQRQAALMALAQKLTSAGDGRLSKLAIKKKKLAELIRRRKTARAAQRNKLKLSSKKVNDLKKQLALARQIRKQRKLALKGGIVKRKQISRLGIKQPPVLHKVLAAPSDDELLVASDADLAEAADSLAEEEVLGIQDELLSLGIDPEPESEAGDYGMSIAPWKIAAGAAAVVGLFLLLR